MPNQPTNRLRWERVPILGKNPVFCFEARRIWTRRTPLLIFLVLFAAMGAEFALSMARLAAVSPRGPRGRAWAVLWNMPHLLPSSTAVEEAIAGDPSRQSWQWMECTSYIAVTGSGMCVIMVTRYILSALAAASLARDRADGRLQQVLASRMSAEDILIGKLMALATPACLPPLAAVLTFGPTGIIEGMPASLAALVLVAIIAEIMVTIMVGIWSGAYVRSPALAVGVALLLAGVVLPIALAHLPAMLTSLVFEPGWRYSPRGLFIASGNVAAHLLNIGGIVGLCGLLFTALWHSTTRALARAAE